MPLFIQHARTGLYLRGLGEWTADPFDAFDFQDSQKAIDFACKHGILGVQIAVRSVDRDSHEVVQMQALAANPKTARQLALIPDSG